MLNKKERQVKKVYISYSDFVMELYVGMSYYLGGTTDLSIKFARIEGKKIGFDAQKVIISGFEELLSENPIKIDVLSDSLIRVHSIFDDGDVRIGEEADTVGQAGVEISDDVMVKVGDGVEVVGLSFKVQQKALQAKATKFSEDGIWRPEDTRLFIDSCAGIGNVITYFNFGYDCFMKFLPEGSKATIFYVKDHLMDEATDLLGQMQQIEKMINVFAGNEDYVSGHVVDAVSNIKTDRIHSEPTLYSRLDADNPFICAPIFLSDKVIWMVPWKCINAEVLKDFR